MQSFVINTATAGDDTLAAGQPNRAIGVTSLVLLSGSDATVTLKSFTPGNASTSLSGPLPLSAGVPLVLPFSPPASSGQRPEPYLQTLPGDALILTLATNVQVSGFGTFSTSPV